MNTDAPMLVWTDVARAQDRVLKIQTKLHRWAAEDPHRRFDDLYNLVSDPAFLVVAWHRVRRNTGSRTAGVDGKTARSIEAGQGVEVFLGQLRHQLKQRSFCPIPVRERLIPKAGGTMRRLGIPATADRVVQACVKLVLEPIFEADFLPYSYGFRPGRRAMDAIAETRHMTSHSYEWVVEGDIEACFDAIEHAALMDRVRRRIADKRILILVKAFLKAGILTTDQQLQDTNTGTPQGGILSPLLANIALSVLDEYFAQKPGGPATPAWERHKRRRIGKANYRLVRYADDFLILVSGSRGHAEQAQTTTAAVLAPMGLHLSATKTMITHIDEGFDFLGWHIQRHRKRGTTRHYVYTYPARKSLRAALAKVKTLSRQNLSQPLAVLLHRLNPVLRGWTTYFRPGVSATNFQYLSDFTWKRVWKWLRRKHPRTRWKELRRRYCNGGWWPTDGDTALFDAGRVSTTRYRYRGTKIATPWTATE